MTVGHREDIRTRNLPNTNKCHPKTRRFTLRNIILALIRMQGYTLVPIRNPVYMFKCTALCLAKLKGLALQTTENHSLLLEEQLQLQLGTRWR